MDQTNTWERFGSWFLDQASCSDDLHLQLALLLHHSYLDVTWVTKHRRGGGHELKLAVKDWTRHEETRENKPMAGVASVCLPTSWAGPSPSRKSLNWLLAPTLMPEKIKLQQEAQQGAKSYQERHIRVVSSLSRISQCSEREGLLTLPRSCSCSCCRCWTLCWAGGSCSGSAPPLCRSRCSSEWERPSPSYSSLLEDERETTVQKISPTTNDDDDKKSTCFIKHLWTMNT